MNLQDIEIDACAIGLALSSIGEFNSENVNISNCTTAMQLGGFEFDPSPITMTGNTSDWNLTGHVSISTDTIIPAETNFDLNLSAVEEGDAVIVTLQYAVSLYERATAGLMIGHYRDILDQVLENEHIQLKNIAVAFRGPAAKAVILEEGEGDFLF